MKILHVYPYFYPTWKFGGITRVVYEISKNLASREHEVTVYTTDAFDINKRINININPNYVNNIRIYYFKNLSNYLACKYILALPFEMFFRINKQIKEFDVIHLHGSRTYLNMIVYYYAKKRKIPYVIQAHGSLHKGLAKQKLRWIYDLLFGYRSLRDAKKVIALSQIEADQYKVMGVPKEKIAIIPNGIDLSDYANLPPKGEFKKKFNIPEDNKIVLYLGRIHISKGIDLLLKAFANLTNKMNCKDTLLVVIGPDAGYLNEVKFLASSLDIIDSILFTGFLSAEDKLKALVDANVFVTPSFSGLPITFLEACATGTPIITTTLGDELGWIDNNVGYVTSPIPTNIADAMYRILLDEDLYNKFSENCKSIVKSEFSLDKLVDRLEYIYK